MRFLLAGMAIVAGVLLLLASVGGPDAFTDPRSAIGPDARFMTRDTPPVAQPERTGAADPAGLRPGLTQERAELQSEIAGLQLQLVETIQNLNEMEAKADQARHELDRLQQELALAKLQSGSQTLPADQTPVSAGGAVPLRRAVPRTDTASAVAGPPRVPRVHTGVRGAAPGGPDASETLQVLDRLRREPSRPADSVAASDAPPVASSTQPARLSPRERLLNARRAIAAGRTVEAQQLLEEAQLQLVFRPVSRPGAGNDAPGGSRAAGRVADALTMLGNGDSARALQHIDQALSAGGGDGQASAPAPASAAGSGPGSSAR